MIKLMNSKGKIPYVLLNGYNILERQLEDVMIRIEVVDSNLKATRFHNEDDLAYIRHNCMNVEEILQRATDYVRKTGDDEYEYDGEPAWIEGCESEIRGQGTPLTRVQVGNVESILDAFEKLGKKVKK